MSWRWCVSKFHPIIILCFLATTRAFSDNPRSDPAGLCCSCSVCCVGCWFPSVPPVTTCVGVPWTRPCPVERAPDTSFTPAQCLRVTARHPCRAFWPSFTRNAFGGRRLRIRPTAIPSQLRRRHRASNRRHAYRRRLVPSQACTAMRQHRPRVLLRFCPHHAMMATDPTISSKSP